MRTKEHIMAILRLISPARSFPTRQVMVILRHLPFRDSKSRGGRRQIMVIPHTFLPSRGDRVWWHAKTNYGHFAPYHPGSIVSDDTQRQIMVILYLVSTKRNEFDSIRMMCQYCSLSKIFAGSTGREIHRPNGVSLERN